MTPTRSQIEAAHAWLNESALRRLEDEGFQETTAHIRTLLAATAEPTEREYERGSAARYLRDRGHPNLAEQIERGEHLPGAIRTTLSSRCEGRR